ncbi:hypothetical protein CK203_006185 [Vitis vinifera]|uniref:Uncharacterized protein n=1 Tax=Vitis vinifera TaxID=29760 RepID=A0A438K5V4_VITVI|nr:hypothetical protein CK203_006185 [Vitis vinifera]
MADRVLEEEAARGSFTTILGREGRAFRKEVGYEDQMQKSTSGEGMVVGLGRGQQCRSLGKKFRVDFRPN